MREVAVTVVGEVFGLVFEMCQTYSSYFQLGFSGLLDVRLEDSMIFVLNSR